MAEIRFKSKKEFNKAVNKHIDTVLEERKQTVTKDVLTALIPIISTCMYEAYGFGEVRQAKFFKYFSEHMECIEKGYTALEMYEKWCQDHNYMLYEMEDTNEK